MTKKFSTMKLKHFLLASALPISTLAAQSAFAQVEITNAVTNPVNTSDANEGAASDVTVTTEGSVTVDTGTAISVDSDNNLTIAGSVGSNDADDTAGVNLVGGNSGDLSVTGQINLVEDYTPSDTDSDGISDETYASGSGRTGILISGASPFVGNISTSTNSTLTVEGNDSYVFRIMSGTGLTGDANFEGALSITGDNSRAISIEDSIIGNLATSGQIAVFGQDSSGVVVDADIDGQYINDGSIVATGYRFSTRLNATGRDRLDDDDLWQAGSAVQINANVSNGVYMAETVTVTVNDDGTTTETITGRSSITQNGSAPAILIDGNGTPISIGLVAQITNPNDDDYDADLQYGFVNQGTLTANGVYDDINATAFQLSDATLVGGLNNTRTMQTTTYRSGDDGTNDANGETGLARVIVFGSGAVADAINNSGLIYARSIEATDSIYADRDSIIAARDVQAIAIDIEANAQLAQIINSGSIIALLTARQGDAIAIIDRSGTLINIENTGSISAGGATSDSLGEAETEFNVVALDLSANTSGVTINQYTAIDEDPDDDVEPNTPSMIGDILLGSGDDTVNVQSGIIAGDLDFADGADVLTLSGGSSYIGHLTDSDGLASLDVMEGSTFYQTEATPIQVGNASFDETSVFRPTINGQTGIASTIVASGDITFADGATISPNLVDIVNSTQSQFTIFDAAGNLDVGGDLTSLLGVETPFLYNTSFSYDPNDPNALIITLDLRSTNEMGLDPVQASSFTSAYEALQNNSDLSNAFTNLTSEEEFNKAINQLLPEFAASARQFVVANVDGATGAVGSHLDNARYSQVKTGGLWLEEFGYFADRSLTGLSEQYRGHGFGVTGGLDSALGPFHTVGLNLGFASTEIEDVVGFDQPLDVMTFQVGGYAGYETGRLSVDGYVGGGFNDFEQTRLVQIGDFSDSSDASWSGTHYNASLRAGYDFWVGERYWVRPLVSVDYLNLQEDGYTENGPTGISLEVEDRTSELAGTTAMLSFGGRMRGDRVWIRPAFRVGYRYEFMNDGVTTNYSFAGLDNRATLESEAFPDQAFLLGFTLAAGSRYSSIGFNFDSDIRDGFIRNTGRLVIRLIF